MADQTIAYNEQMVGSGHPTKADTLNRLALVEHNTDGTHKSLTQVTDPYRDPRADGAVGDGVTDDKAALDLTFANTVIQVPEGTFMGYNLSLAGVNNLSGMGQGSIIKCNNLAANYVIGFQSAGQSTLVIDDLVVDGNKTLGTFTGSGHGVDIRGYDEVYIGRLEVKNTSGHGFQMADCAKVRIGTLVVHDCEKYGVVFDSNAGTGLAEDITIDTLIAYNNGTEGTGWSGINFSDLSATTTGSRRIAIGKVLASNNGRDGIALGRNATAGATGPYDITIGEVLAYGNGNHGIELYGCRNVTIGSVNTWGNTYDGVGIFKGDENAPTYDYALPEDINIGQIVSHDNGWCGVDIMGAFKLTINAIISYNNSIGNTNQYDGVRFWSNNPGANANYAQDIRLGSVLAYDDQVSPTQKNGLTRPDMVNGGHLSIGYIRAYGNVTSDISDGISDPNYVDAITIGEWDVTNITPSYANNIDGAGVRLSPFKVGGMYYGAVQTTGATISSMVRVPIPANKVCSIEAFIQCATNSTLTDRATYQIAGSALNDGSTTTILGTLTPLHSVESNAGMDATIVSGGAGASYVIVRVTGIAATTINWKAMVRVVEH